MAEHRSETTVWRALADPSRRQILDLLKERPLTTGQIAEPFDMSRIAVMRHLSVLADSGLVVNRKRGRERWHYINAVPLLGMADRWVQPLEAGWAGALVRLRDRAEGRQLTSADAEGGLAIDIAQEIRLATERAAVFRALTSEISAWWGPPYLSDRTTDLQLVASLGGMLRELWGHDGGRILATVTALEPDRSLELTGPFHLGLVYGVVEFALDDEAGGTRLRFTHRGIGDVAPDAVEMFAGGWTELLDIRLRVFVERGERRGIAAGAA